LRSIERRSSLEPKTFGRPPKKEKRSTARHPKADGGFKPFISLPNKTLFLHAERANLEFLFNPERKKKKKNFRKYEPPTPISYPFPSLASLPPPPPPPSL
jgi:hypothetical protein